MAFSFDLPPAWRKRWRLKIRDKETVEPPHVSLLLKTECWRLCLRTRKFLDREPDPKAVPPRLMRHILSRVDEFVAVWDEMYPLNPVFSQDRDDDAED